MPRKRQQSSCELPRSRKGSPANKNRIYRFNEDYTWTDRKVETYKVSGNDWAHISRQFLIGSGGERVNFHVRYFEVEPGGYSSFETHKHEHVVIGLRGRGIARLNKRRVEVNYLDVLYIKPETPHRFYNPNNEPFGFLCIVNANRDRPRPVSSLRDK